MQAFDPDALAALAGALPGVPAYWTVGPPRADDDRVLPYPIEVLDAARSRGFAGLALDARAVTPELVVAARAAGVALDVWTVNDAAALRAWLGADVRFVETDRPELVE
ncbi:MAG: hypothetical protein IPL61_17045 [Myxococcales bacterium]|nr:hypothetical protein [Myxococcales bacterium]